MWHQALPRLHVLITEWFASVFSWFHRWYFIFYLIEHFSVAPLAVISLVIELFFFPHSVVLVPLLEWKVSEFLPALNSCFHCGSTALCSNSLMYSQMWDVCPCLLPLEQHTFCCSKSKWTICAFLKIRGCTYIIAKYLIHNHKYLYSTRCVWIWLFVVFSCTGPAAASGLSAAECCCVCVCGFFFLLIAVLEEFPLLLHWYSSGGAWRGEHWAPQPGHIISHSELHTLSSASHHTPPASLWSPEPH